MPVMLNQHTNIISFDNKLKKLPAKLFKYMTLESLGLSFNEENAETLMFAEPSSWKDPYEKIVYNATFTGFEVPQVFACCMTKRMTSEAAWNTYKYDGTGLKGRCAKIVVNTEALLDELDKFAKSEGYSLYIGKVHYVKNNEIKELDKKDNQLYTKCLCENRFTIESFLKLLCLKRDAFFYEEEIRFFLVKNSPINNKLKTPLFVHIDWERVADKIYIEPNCSEMEEKFVRYISHGKEVIKSKLYTSVKKKLNFIIN